MTDGSLQWRFLYYWWATETFDRSLPCRADEFEEQWLGERRSITATLVYPLPGWPMAASSGFAREVRERLSLTSQDGRREPKGMHPSDIRDLLTERWDYVLAEACAYGKYEGLADFGVSVSPLYPPAVFKFGQPMPSDDAELAPQVLLAKRLNGAVGFEPEQCIHPHVAARSFDSMKIGVCLRCCTTRPLAEAVIVSTSRRAMTFEAEKPVQRAKPVVEQSPRPSLSQPYAHHPGDRDRFPLGHAPGDAAVFSDYLGSLRGRS